MSSGEILRIIGIYKMLDMHIRPSEILGIDDVYTAFCFDEVCAFIISEMKDGKVPIIKRQDNKKGGYNKPSDLYSKYNV